MGERSAGNKGAPTQVGEGAGRRTGKPPEGRAGRVAEPALCTPHGGAARARAAPDWRRLLSGASPREVLARLMNGDPLRLVAVVEQRLRARAYLFDADRVFLRAAARCARFAGRYRGEPVLGTWLAERVDEALLDLLRADALAARRGEAPGREQLAAFELLARPLGLEPARMHAACLAHNQLGVEERRAFRELVLEGASLDALAARRGRPATELARAARAALLTLLEVLESTRDDEDRR